jgi:isoquinoline 1-oxidoreductase beta subunit
MQRRDFLQLTGTIGAGLVIGFRIPDRRAVAPFAPNAWLRIGIDNSVLVVVDRSEMGQGVTTSLPMLLAEELEADWTKIRFEFAPADKAYINQLFGIQGTGGSSSVRAAWKPLREAGAQARTMLIAAAAQAWGVEPASCRAEAGAVMHAATKRRLTYGALAQRAAALPVPANVPLKDPKDWRLAGKPTKRLDTRFKVNGTAQFGIDVRVPGMLTAVVARSPVFGGKVRSFDATAAKAIPGVRHVVQISSGVAVVGDGYWPAKQGRDALNVSWDEGPVAQVSSASISSLFAQRATQDGAVARHDGDAVAALAAAAQRVEAVYEMPFLAHATMEPMNCTAHVRAGAVDIWAPTQNQTGVQMVGGQLGGVPPENVAVHTTYLGGGFGRRFELDFIVEALETSKAAGAPVKVIWSREDDIQHAQYRPANYHQLRAGLDASGRAVAWTHRIVAPSIMARMFPQTVKNGLDGEAVEGGVELPYAVPNVHVDYQLTDTGIPVGFWRSVNNSFNSFAVEGFIDELAVAAKQDPYEYRRALLANAPRHRGVLELAASRAGWGTALPSGRGRGIAVFKSFESFAAQVAEVSVSPAGDVRVHRVVCAIDCGMHVNPSTIEAQMQGGIVYGLTAALNGAITIENGRVMQSNFHDYPMLRLAEMPVVEVYIVPSNEAPGGVGEPGTPPIAPAVCNAIFAATGKRIRKLPIGKVSA